MPQGGFALPPNIVATVEERKWSVEMNMLHDVHLNFCRMYALNFAETCVEER